jgi:hypothetical protein
LLSDHPIVSHMPASKASAQGPDLGWWRWFLPFPSPVRNLPRTWPPRILGLWFLPLCENCVTLAPRID